jgi:hypothetical protein
MEITFMALFRTKFPFKGTRSGDWLATQFPLEEQSKTEFGTGNH